MVDLLIVRHGESQWNKENRFTGWVDVDLSDKGITEAKEAGQLIKKSNMDFALAHTSFLRRAVKTLWLIQEESGIFNLPVFPAWELNERHYGALTGLNKAETTKKYGDAQVKIWRRSYDIRPPLLEQGNANNPSSDKRYNKLPDSERPLGESLADTMVRVSRYFESTISLQLQKNNNILISAHGNSLRALVKYLENMSDAEVLELNIPTGKPLHYKLNWQNCKWDIIEKGYLGN